MFPNSINPASLLGSVFLRQLHNRFSSFPNIFGQLYRSILGSVVDQSGYPFSNSEMNEISWSATPPPADLLPDAQYTKNPMPLSHRLDRAVKSYVGTSYEEIDCYELLVKGITDMGFRYHGAGGIKDRLIQRAEAGGNKPNAYLTGEGLVHATGNMIYSRSLKPAGNHGLRAAQIYEEMTRRLGRGHILSFSTRTRGHTGIISRREGRLTFINSGNMDHNLNGKRRSMEVGEEDLKAEIENWLRRAAKRNEELQISVGRLNGRKLAGYINPGSLIEKRV